jgi:hypothetical protein
MKACCKFVWLCAAATSLWLPPALLASDTFLAGGSRSNKKSLPSATSSTTATIRRWASIGPRR